MQLTIDSDKQKLADVLRVLGAVYQVDLAPAAAVGAGAGGARTRNATKAVARTPLSTPGKKTAGRGEPAAATVRAWALAQGREISTRGALPRTLIEEYKAAVAS